MKLADVEMESVDYKYFFGSASAAVSSKIGLVIVAIRLVIHAEGFIIWLAWLLCRNIMSHPFPVSL